MKAVIKDNTSNESYSRDHCAEQNSSLNKEISWNQNLKQTFKKSQFYKEQNGEAEKVRMVLIRNLNLKDPRTKTSCNCDRRNQLFLKLIKSKTFQSTSQSSYLEEINEIHEIDKGDDQMIFTRNLSLKDPRTKITCNCDRRSQLFLKFIEYKAFQRASKSFYLGEIQEIDKVDKVDEIKKIEVDEVQKIQKLDKIDEADEVEEIETIDKFDEISSDFKNEDEINAHSTPKTKTRRTSVNISIAIKDKVIENFLKDLGDYVLKYNIEHFRADKHSNLKRLNYNRLDQNFHFCDPFLDLQKFIDALGSITQYHQEICKVGSTEAKLVKDKTGYFKIFVQNNYKDLQLSDIVAIYTYDVDYRNHCERVAVQCGIGLSGIGNAKADNGALQVQNSLKTARLLYIVPLNKSKEKELSVRDIIRSNSNDNNYIHIVTHYLLEMSEIESTFCGECNKVCKSNHSHTGTPDVYKNKDKIDLTNTKTLIPTDLEKVEETNKIIHGSARFSTVFGRYKERILHWTEYFKQNFGGCKYVISSHVPYFKISYYELWYQNKHNKNEIKTIEKILNDVKESHRYICKIDKKCIFESVNRKDTEKHMKEHHFTELTKDELTKKVLESIVNK